MLWHFKIASVLLTRLLFLFPVTVEWGSNIISEKRQGIHTGNVVYGLQVGMVLFILSEVMFFVSFFWAFFIKCFQPEVKVDYSWPPVLLNLVAVDRLSIPLFNTLLLLSSGVSVTSGHHYLLAGETRYTFFCLVVTICLGSVFLGLQIFEYGHSLVRVRRVVYGSTFFLLTGFHGFHVTVGVVLLVLLGGRAYFHNFSNLNLVGFEVSRWYWHFVDVV